MPDYVDRKLKKTKRGWCPFAKKACLGDRCELFTTEAPDDVHRHELKSEGIEYAGMCGFRMLGMALGAMSRKQNSMADIG